MTARPLAEVGERLAAMGHPIIEGPVARTGATGPLISIYVRDPDGNLIEIAQAQAGRARWGRFGRARGPGRAAPSTRR